MRGRLVSNGLGLVGAVIGGTVGFFIFRWLLVSQGLYGLMIPGALVGLGCNRLSLHRSNLRGIACAVGALGLGIFSEWKLRPFRTDDGFSYFLGHMTDLKTITVIMIGLGACFAYWIGKDSSSWLTRFFPEGKGSQVNPPSSPSPQ